jgi:hypothetical protein
VIRITQIVGGKPSTLRVTYTVDPLRDPGDGVVALAGSRHRAGRIERARAG